MISLLMLLNSIQLIISCCLISQPNSMNQTHVLFNNFKTFNELNFKTCNTDHFNTMSIIPNSQLLLDDSLNFTGLKMKHTSFSLSFILLNLRDINLESDVFEKVLANPLYNSKTIFRSLVDSTFAFYRRNNLIDETACDESILSIDKNFLSNFTFLDISAKVIFPKTLCPLVFHKAKISYFYVTMVNSLFTTNILIFSNISDHASQQRLHSLIGFLNINSYRIISN